MRNVNGNAFPERAGDSVRGVDPAVSVEHTLWDVMSVNTIDWVAKELSGSHKYGGRYHQCD